MKQRISIEQLNELSEEQKERLREWWMGSNPRLSDIYVVKVKYDDVTRYEGPYVNSGHRDFLNDFNIGEALPFLSIGQMIEIISVNRKRLAITTYDGGWDVVASSGDLANGTIEIELCDALWDITKKLL